MTKDLRAFLVKHGHEPFAYSGRRMRGAECVAIQLNTLGELWQLGWVFAADIRSHNLSDDDAPSLDNLGTSFVVYWPDEEWVENQPLISRRSNDGTWHDVPLVEPSRCVHCGYGKSEAQFNGSTHCVPPFKRQPHVFSRQTRGRQ